MAEKYWSFGPYCYVLNNPLKFVDSDGRKVEFAPGSSQEFKNKVVATINYMNAKGTSGFFNSLSKSEKVYYLQETHGAFSQFDSKTSTIFWNASVAKITTEGVVLSPATILNHELDHANQYDTNTPQFMRDTNSKTGKDSQYDSKEERRVIEGSEQETARKHGEIQDGEITRKDHRMIGRIQVDDPTSTGSVVITGKTKSNTSQSNQSKPNQDKKDDENNQ